MAVNQFDSVAPIYDRLALLVFGKQILTSQIANLDLVREDDHVLVIGGGTGKMLSSFPNLLSVDYLEKSKVMIRKARQISTECSIEFIQQDFLLFDSSRQYDIVLCPFFLDCFDEPHLVVVIDKIKNLLKPGGYLMVADFESKKLNKALSWLMHLFFRSFSSLESSYLKPIHHHVLKGGFQLVREKFFHQKAIFSRVYRNL